MVAWMAIAKEIKDSINNKIDGITGGIQQAGNIYGGNSAGLSSNTVQSQPQQVSPFPAQQTQAMGNNNSSFNANGQYSFPINISSYIPNTEFAQRVSNRQPNKLFQFLSNEDK